MEVARRLWRSLWQGLWRERLAPALTAFAVRVGDAVEEGAFRLFLAYEVLAGRQPQERRRRYWNRARETPVLIDAYDWTDDRLIFSLLVWPVLDSNIHEAPYAQDERARQVKESFGRVCADLAWSTRFETTYGLEWDPAREVWTDREGHAYDGERLFGYSRART